MSDASGDIGVDPERTRSFGEQVRFGKTASDYGRFRAGFPVAFFDELRSRGLGGAGQRVLDLGTGTGTLARGLAAEGAQVVGLDPASELMEQGARLDAEEGVSVSYVVERAERTDFEADSFDLVTAGQCWHWFDREAVATEVCRVLAPNGRVVIAHFDWIPLEGNVVDATEERIRRANPDWTMGGGTGLYPAWLSDLALAGFERLETFSFDIDAAYTHEGWRGRIRASAGIRATLSEDEVQRFDAELAELLRERFPADPLAVPHRCWAVVGHAPA